MERESERNMSVGPSLGGFFVLLAFAIAGTLLMFFLGAFEQLYRFAQPYQKYGLGEAVVFFPSFLVLGLLLFVHRQIEQLNAQIKLRLEAEKALRESELKYRDLSITDGLTQLFNPRHFHKVLSAELDRAKRYDTPVSLLLLDIDNFKRFNDEFGHQEGNMVLVEVAKIMRESIRESDSAYRYGGEEFSVILVGTSSQGAIMVAERIRKSMEQRAFHPTPEQPVHVTISLGVAQYAPGEEATELVARADRNMYVAKQKGKNQVYFQEKS